MCLSLCWRKRGKQERAELGELWWHWMAGEAGGSGAARVCINRVGTERITAMRVLSLSGAWCSQHLLRSLPRQDLKFKWFWIPLLCQVIPLRNKDLRREEGVMCPHAGLGRHRRPPQEAQSAPLSGAHELKHNVDGKNLILRFPRLTGEQICFHYNHLSLTRYQSYKEIAE